MPSAFSNFGLLRTIGIDTKHKVGSGNVRLIVIENEISDDTHEMIYKNIYKRMYFVFTSDCDWVLAVGEGHN